MTYCNINDRIVFSFKCQRNVTVRCTARKCHLNAKVIKLTFTAFAIKVQHEKGERKQTNLKYWLIFSINVKVSIFSLFFNLFHVLKRRLVRKRNFDFKILFSYIPNKKLVDTVGPVNKCGTFRRDFLFRDLKVVFFKRAYTKFQ